jgi:hypothetical protein
MADNIITTLGDRITSVVMPEGTVIATTENMIQILNIDAKGMIREWRFEVFEDGLQLYKAPDMPMGEVEITYRDDVDTKVKLRKGLADAIAEEREGG